MTNALNSALQSEESRIKPLAVMRADELFNLPEVDEVFLVDRLIPLGGLSLLAGKPKDGKSCLARQLAVDVAQGMPFLGRPTMQAAVLYIGLEESKHQFLKAIKAAGMTAADPLYSYINPLLASASEVLGVVKATLDEYPDVKLVIVDTLLKLARMKDSNDYMAAQRALEGLHNLGVDRGVTILGLHHNRKAVSSDSPSSSNMSGSTAISANANNILEVYRQRPSEASSPRILRMVEYRYGEELQPTVLSFDSDSQRYTICSTVSELQRQESDELQKQAEVAVLEYVAKNPGRERDQIVSEIKGRRSNETIGAIYRLLRSDPPAIMQRGKGVKGDPFTYHLTEIPMESAA